MKPCGQPWGADDDLRTENPQNMPNGVRNNFYGHNKDLFNMMVFLGKYGANEMVFQWRMGKLAQDLWPQPRSSFKNVAEVIEVPYLNR